MKNLQNKINITDRKITIPVENIGKIDINMPDFCLGIIGKMKIKDQPDTIEICDTLDRNKKIILTRGSFGFPNQSTRDTLLVLKKLAWQKKMLGSRSTPITAYEIMNQLGGSVSGKNLKTLKQNLDILQQTQIKHINSFFDKTSGENMVGTFAFSIIGSYYIKELGIVQPDYVKAKDKELWSGYITWEENFFESILQNAKNLISFDYAKYMQIRGDIAKQLFLFLSKRSYRSNYIQLPFISLVHHKLGISQSRSLYKIKYELKSVHQQLIDLRIIQIEPEYFDQNGVEYVKYTFVNNYSENQKARLLESQETGNEEINDEVFIDIQLSESIEVGNLENQKVGELESQEVDLELENTKKRFIDLGLTEANYGKMINKYSYQKILDGLDLLDLEINNGTKIRSKKKWFLACLNQEFDTDSLFADREKVEIETQNKIKTELQKLEDQKNQDEQKKLAEQKAKQLEDWMSKNMFEVVEECEKYAKEIIDKGGIMANMLTKTAKENNETNSKAILTNPIFAGNLKTRLWARVEGIEIKD